MTALKLSSEPGSSAAALCGPTTPLEGDHSAVDNEPGEHPIQYSNGCKLSNPQMKQNLNGI